MKIHTLRDNQGYLQDQLMWNQWEHGLNWYELLRFGHSSDHFCLMERSRYILDRSGGRLCFVCCSLVMWTALLCWSGWGSHHHHLQEASSNGQPVLRRTRPGLGRRSVQSIATVARPHLGPRDDGKWMYFLAEWLGPGQAKKIRGDSKGVYSELLMLKIRIISPLWFCKEQIKIGMRPNGKADQTNSNGLAKCRAWVFLSWRLSLTTSFLSGLLSATGFLLSVSGIAGPTSQGSPAIWKEGGVSGSSRRKL